jgi:hypothetical protein
MRRGPIDHVRPCAASILIAFVTVFLAGATANAQEHRHPKQDEEIHVRFYSTWMMPDNPQTSCCNLADCYPTEAQYRDGTWYAKRREDGKWLRVPPEKVEQNRDSPDGRNHLCAPPPPTASNYSAPDTVFCFKQGGGA